MKQVIANKNNRLRMLMNLPGAVNISGNNENPPKVDNKRKKRACSRLSNASKLNNNASKSKCLYWYPDKCLP